MTEELSNNSVNLFNSILNKLNSWNLILKKEPYEWYTLYEICAVRIYQNDFYYLRNNIIRFNKYEISELFTKKNKYDVLHNFMLLICVFSQDVEILDFFFNEFNGNIDVNKKQYVKLKDLSHNRSSGMELNYLKHTLQRQNKNLKIVKYLIEKCKINPEIDDGEINGLNSIHYAINNYDCKYNSDFEIIKYLFEECGINIFSQDNYGKTYLAHACYNFNSDIKLIKYLVEKIKIDITKNNYEYLNEIICALDLMDKKPKNNINNICEIFSYALNYCDIKDIVKLDSLDLNYIGIKILKNLTKRINNYEKLNIILKKIIEDNSDPYKKEEIINLLESIDPSLLNEKYSEMADVKHFKLKYKDFVKYVDEFKYKSNQSKFIKSKLRKLKKEKKINYQSAAQSAAQSASQSAAHGLGRKTIDHLEKSEMKKNLSEILFEHDSNVYYGDRKIICNSILLLKDIENDNLFNETVNLGVDLKVPCGLLRRPKICHKCVFKFNLFWRNRFKHDIS